MDEGVTDTETYMVVIALGSIAFLGLAGTVLLARAVRPAVERLAATDLRTLAEGFGEALRYVAETETRRASSELRELN